MVSRVPPRLRAWGTHHPYAAVLLVALAVRVVVALGLELVLPGVSFFDDGTYHQLAEERVNGGSAQWDSYASWLYVHTGTLLLPVTLLYRVFGPNVLLGALLVALFGASVAAVTARLVALLAGLRAGVSAGLLMAFLPSQVLVSSVLAKDALTWFLLASLALVVATASATRSPGRVVWLVALASGLLTLLGLLRLHTMTVAAFALLLTAAFGHRATRKHRVAGFAVVAVLVPLATGIGPLGLQLVANHGSLEGTRAYHASGGSAVEGLAPAKPAAPKPGAGGAQAPPPAVPPTSVAAPDRGDGAGADVTEAVRSLSYLPRGITVILLEPFPWRTDGSAAFRLAGLEAIVWYPVLALGLVGAAASWRRRDVLAFPVLAGGALVCMWALVDGNIGTAFRHRGEIVWAVVLLAAHGATVLRRGRPAPAVDPAAPEAAVGGQGREPARAR